MSYKPLWDSHPVNTSNPHSVTAAQVGALSDSFPICRCYLNDATQSIDNTTWTTVNYVKDWEEDVGTGGWSDANHRFTVPSAGLYEIMAAVTWTSIAASTSYRAKIYHYDLSTTTWIDHTFIANTTTATLTYMTQQIQDIIVAEAGDYIQIKVYHERGGAEELLGSTPWTILTIRRIK